jgi:hypothetical protein
VKDREADGGAVGDGRARDGHPGPGLKIGVGGKRRR